MTCWARQIFMAVVAILGISQMIAACGQKGPLYLPKEQEQQQAQGRSKGQTGDKAAQGAAAPAPDSPAPHAIPGPEVMPPTIPGPEVIPPTLPGPEAVPPALPGPEAMPPPIR